MDAWDAHFNGSLLPNDGGSLVSTRHYCEASTVFVLRWSCPLACLQLMIHFTHPPFSLTCWCTFIAHWSAGAAAVHIGRFRGDTPRATASVIHVLICFSVHHAWGSLKGSWGSWWGWAGCHAANLGEIFISWSVANNLQQENRTGTFTPKARCQDQNHLSARLFLCATVHEG